MLPLRRAALRALSARAAPSPLLSSSIRSFVTYSSQTYRPQQQWQLSRFQKRFASDEAKVGESATGSPSEAEQQAAAEVASVSPDAPAEQSDAIVDAVVSSQEPSTEAAVPESVADSAEAVQSATSSFSQPINEATGAASVGAAAQFLSSQSQNTRPERRTPSANAVYVGNLFFEVTEQDLRAQFESAGEIDNVRIIYDQRGLSKGFGFVEFKDKAAAQQAIDTLNNEVFQGRRITVQPHRRREEYPRQKVSTPNRPNPPSNTLFIGNMSFEMSDKDLNDLFREVRNVLDVRVAIDRRSGQPRGFAHADFIDVASAMKAKEQLEGKEVYGRNLRVDFTMSTPGGGSSRGAGRQ